ncbi:hypothetical protein Cpap_1473 [Ruminiclostridium papyrosolvens DSM 2782]|uniref:Uncharacterized protein n=1 Tax=Ruminiclostridium papyrosolvens DSM 2782 TaxID=588581 RepID=F1TEB5_9FIRM|nr:hypothetical protein [Ruminiclostridium papyrosolvens]EGD47081.1 hypothetical protein Cpap_1473 [Ruminiclostridium papyrosolvens DSM 2782]WES36023.1 hypothetical protein P0092_08695 [Ruminiclostridium papyrosolvens DSM 2782]WES36121.1 hypothetical protein P0092_09195 [Ruminiclostridium papyrosolvens DSM 2782]
MDKETLRPVIVDIPDWSGYTQKGINTGIQEGYFHGFSEEGTREDGLNSIAIVELRNGNIVTVISERIKFADRKDT